MLFCPSQAVSSVLWYFLMYMWIIRSVHSIPNDLGFGKWRKPQLTWTIYRYPDARKHPKMSSKAFERYVHDSMTKALKIWSKAVPIQFLKDESKSAQIKVFFYSLAHKDRYPFDGTGGELAHTFYPDEQKKGEIHIDDDEPWSPDGGRNLEWTLAHELGHALGIPHLSAPSLMQEGYRGYLNSPRLTPIDIEAAKMLYNLN
ncbi:unnamed protein product [Auanema sp. JU1783]|nr:unnamed protein product [Auanema sp. JU1783]